MTSALLKKHSFDRVFDAQAVFRLVLDCMANPLRKVSISAYEEKLLGEYTGFLALAMVLLDNEVGFFADD
ncbi:MAG TPA: phosphonate C-P lyase system protein PhnH, partial [Bacillota bacterium]|nr:phosphonate C-P lyase system protein PhnH [Bacillota bacterium]